MRIEKEEDANRLLIAAGKTPQKRASVAAGVGIRT